MANSTVVVITGANTGIGYETIKALLSSSADRSYHIYLGSRDTSKGEAAAQKLKSEALQTQSTIEVLQIDVESDDSIAAAAKVVQDKSARVDVLINNAGAMFDIAAAQGKMSKRQAWNKAWDTNVAGAQIMTETFIPLLLASADPRLLFITSGLSSLTTASDASNPRSAPPAPGWPKQNPMAAPAYRSTKAGLNMMMLEWARTLKNDGVKVWAVSPGFLATGLGGGTAEQLRAIGAGDASQGGAIIRAVVEGKRDADVGKVVQGYKSVGQAGAAAEEGEAHVQPW